MELAHLGDVRIVFFLAVNKFVVVLILLLSLSVAKGDLTVFKSLLTADH